VILFLHHRYRLSGGEERAVEDLMWLVREHLGEDAELLERDSALLGRAGAAAGIVAGGLRPAEIARAVRRTGARIVHAHNLHPTLGWRALAAAREAGAAVVLHLHQYRLVCAIGVCFRDGHECTRCHARNTLPGVLLNCRGSRPEALSYGAGLALWQPRLAAQPHGCVVPSRFAEARLRALGAPIGETSVVPHVIRDFAPAPAADAGGGHALLTARLVPEKGVAVAIEACRIAGVPLVVAGEGPERERLERELRDGDGAGVRFVGHATPEQLAQLRRSAAVALAPSLFAETFGLAAAEAMAAGLPVAASRIGALPEVVPDDWLVTPGDAPALAAAIERLRGDPEAPAKAIVRARTVAAPEVVAPLLAGVYARAEARAGR
jgi:glycosyltransferase involved in cell wall biosynthesis